MVRRRSPRRQRAKERAGLKNHRYPATPLATITTTIATATAIRWPLPLHPMRSRNRADPLPLAATSRCHAPAPAPVDAPTAEYDQARCRSWRRTGAARFRTSGKRHLVRLETLQASRSGVVQQCRDHCAAISPIFIDRASGRHAASVLHGRQRRSFDRVFASNACGGC